MVGLRWNGGLDKGCHHLTNVHLSAEELKEGGSSQHVLYPQQTLVSLTETGPKKTNFFWCWFGFCFWCWLCLWSWGSLNGRGCGMLLSWLLGFKHPTEPNFGSRTCSVGQIESNWQIEHLQACRSLKSLNSPKNLKTPSTIFTTPTSST